MGEELKLETYGEDEAREEQYQKAVRRLDRLVNTQTDLPPKEAQQQVNIPKEKKENVLINVWRKTIFPSKIQEYRDRKTFKAKVQSEARKSAMEELKPDLIKYYKQEELNKMTKKKKLGVDFSPNPCTPSGNII